jgi:hypothetical protein
LSPAFWKYFYDTWRTLIFDQQWRAESYKGAIIIHGFLQRTMQNSAELLRSNFLLLSDSTENYNARVAYLELLRIPNKTEIREVAKLKTLARWSAGATNIFYRRNSGEIS